MKIGDLRRMIALFKVPCTSPKKFVLNTDVYPHLKATEKSLLTNFTKSLPENQRRFSTVFGGKLEEQAKLILELEDDMKKVRGTVFYDHTIELVSSSVPPKTSTHKDPKGFDVNSFSEADPSLVGFLKEIFRLVHERNRHNVVALAELLNEKAMKKSQLSTILKKHKERVRMFAKGFVGSVSATAGAKIVTLKGQMSDIKPTGFGNNTVNRASDLPIPSSLLLTDISCARHIEANVLRALPICANAMVVGGGEKHLSVFLTLSTRFLDKMNPSNMLSHDIIEITTNQFNLEMLTTHDFFTEMYGKRNPELLSMFDDGIIQANNLVSSDDEKIRRWIILPTEFSVANGELDTSFKIDRKNVIRIHKESVKLLYGDSFNE